MSSSGTSCPLSTIGLTRIPSSVPCSIAARSMSPVAMCGMPYSASIRFAWVPFPEPCGPSNSMFTLFEETLVGAHHHLRLHLPHCVERDTDRDQHRSAAERAPQGRGAVQVRNDDAGQRGD